MLLFYLYLYLSLFIFRSFFFFVCLFIIIYVLNIVRAIKKMSVNEIKDFIFGTIINELFFLKKTVIIQRNAWKNYLIFYFVFKQINSKYKEPCDAKEHYPSFIKEKHKIIKTIRNNYLPTKNFSSSKGCRYKITPRLLILENFCSLPFHSRLPVC